MDSSLGSDLTNRGFADPRCPLNLTTRQNRCLTRLPKLSLIAARSLKRMHQLHHFTTSSTPSVGELCLMLTCSLNVQPSPQWTSTCIFLSTISAAYISTPSVLPLSLTPPLIPGERSILRHLHRLLTFTIGEKDAQRRDGRSDHNRR